MGFLKSGVSQLRHRDDTANTSDTGAYLRDLSAAAQRAELAGDQLRADAAHHEINGELDNLG